MVSFDRKTYNAGLLLPTKLEKMKEGYQIGPPWLRPLLTAKFFTICQVHGESNRNECNLYCLDCMGEALCSSCTPQHRDHHVVQIRRSSYHDVVRVSELQKVLDLMGVQTYIINSARVVFLNARPQPRHAKGVTKTCEICDRSLLDSFRYCSIGCKLTGIRLHNDMTFHLQPKQQQQQHQHQVLQQQQQQQQQSHDMLDAAPPCSPPPAAVPTMIAAAAAARSSVTSEDTASSGGSSGSKRTRSSRRKQEMQQQELDQEGDSAIRVYAFDISSVVQRSLGTLKLRPDEAAMPGATAPPSPPPPAPRPHQQRKKQQSKAAAPQQQQQPGSPAAAPPTPPPTRTAKRRKGTPHRAPLGM